MTRARDVASNGGLTLVTKADFNSVTTININNCFSSAYNNYRIIIENTASSATSGANIEWRTRNNGTDDSSGVYSWAGIERTNTFLSFDAQNISYGFIGRGAITGGWGQSVMDVIQPFTAEYTTIIAHTAGVSTAADSYVTIQTMRRVASSHDGITFLLNNSCTGTVYVYGYRK